MCDFDIIVHGATGFVGKLTAAQLAAAHPDLTIALSGRSESRLAEVQRAHAPSAALLVADSLDPADMASLAARARVIISCVGPYSRLGGELVAACADAGTHYVDLCGEAPFIRRMIDEHQDRATETGARIVHSCGFDSVPSDMGAFALLEHAGEPLTRDTMVVEELRGGLSGGTIDSMREVSAAARRDRSVARNLHHPYSLSPRRRRNRGSRAWRRTSASGASMTAAGPARSSCRCSTPASSAVPVHCGTRVSSIGNAGPPAAGRSDG